MRTTPGRRACEAFGGLDLLVNNASTFYPTRFGEIEPTQWDDLIASNYRAPLFLAQTCYPALKQSRGGIVNLVDIYASNRWPGTAFTAAPRPPTRC